MITEMDALSRAKAALEKMLADLETPLHIAQECLYNRRLCRSPRLFDVELDLLMMMLILVVVLVGPVLVNIDAYWWKPPRFASTLYGEKSRSPRLVEVR